MADSEVAALPARSRELNAAEGITGLLVHLRLDHERDELHEGVTVLFRGPVESARFRQWSMRFATVDEA